MMNSSRSISNTQTQMEINQQIEFLKAEIERLHQAEQGFEITLAAGAQQQQQQSKTSTYNDMKLTDDSRNNNNNSSFPKKAIAMLFGILLLIGTIVGIISTLNFMKRNQIQFSNKNNNNGSNNSNMNNFVTIEELAMHNTEDDCWMAIAGNVYDLTVYARRHPGGSEIVTRYAGMDATQAYSNFHSLRLLRSVERNMVGPLLLVDENSNNSSNNPSPINSSNTQNNNNNNSFNDPYMQNGGFPEDSSGD